MTIIQNSCSLFDAKFGLNCVYNNINDNKDKNNKDNNNKDNKDNKDNNKNNNKICEIINKSFPEYIIIKKFSYCYNYHN